jgi:preprotein translocase SecE subunit
VARDRQRAKQRRRARAGTPDGSGLPAPSQPARESVPGSLDHVSGEVDEFEAAIVTGSGDHANADAEAAFGNPDGDLELERQAVESAPAAARAAQRPAGADTGPARRGPARFIAFLRACWSELQRVQWPDRRQVGQATAVVIGFVVVAGLYLGVADYVAKQIVNAII